MNWNYWIKIILVFTFLLTQDCYPLTTDTPLSDLQLVESTGTNEIFREGNVRTNLKRTEGIENLGTEELELVSEEDNEDDNNIHNLEEREEQPLIEVTTKNYK